MAFENLIGNEKIKQLLQIAVKENNIVHSYLFIGENGIGKTLFATEFAQMLLCENSQNKPCNTCKSCIEFKSLNHPDFMIIEPEDGKTIKIEQIRYLRRKNIRKTNYFC